MVLLAAVAVITQAAIHSHFGVAGGRVQHLAIAQDVGCCGSRTQAARSKVGPLGATACQAAAARGAAACNRINNRLGIFVKCEPRGVQRGCAAARTARQPAHPWCAASLCCRRHCQGRMI